MNRLVFRQGLALVGAGGLIGLAGAAALARTLGSILFGVTPFDPLTYAGVVAVVAVSALTAMWAPAQRAIALDPVKSLKAE
jgi:putative ABC transport system permease protein